MLSLSILCAHIDRFNNQFDFESFECLSKMRTLAWRIFSLFQSHFESYWFLPRVEVFSRKKKKEK